MQKLAWLTGLGGVGPGQSRTPWMFCERLLKERQLMAPETEHQKGTDAKPRKAHFTKDGRGPLGSAGRVRTGWLWDPAHPSRLPRSTQEAHESSWADGLDAGGAGSPAGPHCGPQPLPRNTLLHPWILILSPPPTMGRLTAGAGKASSQPPGRPHPTLKKGSGHRRLGLLGRLPSPVFHRKSVGPPVGLPLPCPGCRELRDAPAPFPGDQTEPRRRALRGGAGPAGGAGRQAAPLALEHRLSGRDCGLRRAPAPRQFGLRLQAGDLRPLTVSQGPAGPGGGGARVWGLPWRGAGAGEWGAGQAGGAGGRSLREGC